MSKFEVAAEVFEKLPTYCLGVVVARGVDNGTANVKVTQMMNDEMDAFVQRMVGVNLKEYPGIQPYRNAFLSLGMNPNKFMCSVEALSKRVQKGNRLPNINPIVDLGNALSLKYCLPMGAHDIEKLDGDMTVRFVNHYKGEIGQLGDSFNAMVEKINELLGVVYKEQKNKREAELKILHEQIKPHFLYNTLDTIQWMAKQYHAQDIVDLVLALSGFFRISLSQGKEFITLEQEVLMVKNYLDIQKVRYEDLFEYKTEIEEGLGNYMVLKICLQPLVENALYHGIKESDQDRGTIWIRAFSESEDSIILKVEDDGAGMSQERIDQLNSWLKLKERGEEVKAYGTLNVNDRIKIAYGDEYGLHYEKRTGGGTVAVVRLKRLQKEVCGKF